MSTDTTPVLHSTPLQILESFASSIDLRAYLHRPWKQGDYAYATNGHMAVRMRMCEDFAGVPQHTKDHPKNLADMFLKAVFEPLCAVPAIEKPATCLSCKGTKVSYLAQCPDCDGMGEFRHGDHYYECKECDGDGSTRTSADDGEAKPCPCAHCDGRGYAANFKSIAIGNTLARDAYLWQISQLPGVQFAANADPMKAIAFRFDGGEVLLMPCRT